MRKNIIAFIAAIRSENGLFITLKTIYHGNECADFICIPTRLKNCIYIALALKVIQGIQMKEIVALRILVGMKITRRVFGVCRIMQIASITGKNSISVNIPVPREHFVEFFEEKRKSTFRKL